VTVRRGSRARELGLSWERSLAARIRAMGGWDARRVGAASPHLPDVLAWTAAGTPRSALVAACKATSRNKPLTLPR